MIAGGAPEAEPRGVGAGHARPLRPEADETGAVRLRVRANPESDECCHDRNSAIRAHAQCERLRKTPPVSPYRGCRPVEVEKDGVIPWRVGATGKKDGSVASQPGLGEFGSPAGYELHLEESDHGPIPIASDSVNASIAGTAGVKPHLVWILQLKQRDNQVFE